MDMVTKEAKAKIARKLTAMQKEFNAVQEEGRFTLLTLNQWLKELDEVKDIIERQL